MATWLFPLGNPMINDQRPYIKFNLWLKKNSLSLLLLSQTPPLGRRQPLHPQLWKLLLTLSSSRLSVTKSYQFYLLNNSPILLCIQKKFKTFDLPTRSSRAGGTYVISGHVTSHVLKRFPHSHHADLFTASSQNYFSAPCPLWPVLVGLLCFVLGTFPTPCGSLKQLSIRLLLISSCLHTPVKLCFIPICALNI